MRVVDELPGLSMVASAATTIALAGRLVASFFQAIRQDRFGMVCRPPIGEHRIETDIVGVQTQEKFADIGPRLNPMTLGASEDCA